MKCLHRADLYGWSQFNEERNIDFHSVLWVRPDGNVVVDPLPLSPHDQEHLQQLGGAAWIIVTNSDHVRDAEELAEKTSAKLAGPCAEAANFPIRCDRWLEDGEEVVPGLKVFELEGSKTAGELALLLEGATLIVGDLVRVHEGGRLRVLPDAKLLIRQRPLPRSRGLLPQVKSTLYLPATAGRYLETGIWRLWNYSQNLDARPAVDVCPADVIPPEYGRADMIYCRTQVSAVIFGATRLSKSL